MASTQIDREQKTGFYKLTPEQYHKNVMAAVEVYNKEVARVKALNEITWNTAVQPLEIASEDLDSIWNLLEHENAVANTPEVREVYEKLLPVVTELHSESSQDQELYNIYQQIKNSPEFASYTQAQKAIIDHALRSFKLGGVDLPIEKRNKLKDLHAKLSALESKFSNNVLDATESWTYHITTAQKFLLDGLPERLIEAAALKATKAEKSGWVLSLDSPTCIDVASYAQNRQLREEFYMAYNCRASDQGPSAGKFDNTKVIADILALRQEIAHLTGYRNYAEYSLVPKMASSTTEVKNFLNDLVARVQPFAKKEYAELKEFAKAQGFEQDLQAWDVGYYSERMREQKYQINEEELRVYFPAPKVMAGLFALAGKLFGVKIEEESDFVSWAPGVRMFRVTDKNGHLRGHFYTDLYTRDGKRGGAWMAECITRMRFGTNVLQTPIAYLNCNFAPPQENQPGLLTHQDVLVLFHEFGHTMHHVMTQIDYYSVAGLNGVEWDAVELPSQLMENWAWEWDVIQDITENINNGEPMPKAIFEKLLAGKNFHSGLFLNRQLTFSIFDFRIHEEVGQNNDRTAHEVLEDIRKEIAVVPVPPANRFENGFSHIFAGGYSAGYYSYLWAEVLACDAYGKFIASELIDSRIGNEFLTKILEKGGSEPAMDLFVTFMGRKPTVDALLKNYALT